MCNIHFIEKKKSVTVWILVFCLLWEYYRTRIQYLSTLLRPAQAHKHFHFPATALYFWVLGIQHPPVMKKKRIWNKGNGEVYSTENYYWRHQTWSQRTHGSKLHTASSEQAKPTLAGGGGRRKVQKARKFGGTGEGKWKKGSLRSSLGSILQGHSLPEGLLRKCHRYGQVPLYFEWQVTGRERTRSHLLSRAAPASLLTVSLRELARRLDSIRQEQLLLSLNPDFLWSKDVLI